MEYVRDSAFGQIVRYVTSNRVFQFPEERAGFQLPGTYNLEKKTSSEESTPRNSTSAIEKQESDTSGPPTPNELTTARTHPDVRPSASRTASHASRRPDLSRAQTQADVEIAFEEAIKQEITKSQPAEPITPAVTNDGKILVDWYATDDPENPQNWRGSRKWVPIGLIYAYTFSIYIGSSIFAPSIPLVAEQAGVSLNVASLGLSMYVFGYGLGPLLWSPLSEIAAIGRNPPYIITYAIFVIISIPAAIVNNFPALIVLRFLQGFFGSPALATGGATLGDMVTLMQLPYYLAIWAAAATMGPGFGPLVSGFAVAGEDWHWSLWELLWLSAPICIAMFFFMPETSASNILSKRAARLRKLTGNSNYVSQAEIDQSKMGPGDLAAWALWKPLQINMLDPAILFTSVYVAFVYGCFYSFFESFPLVYGFGNPGHPDSKGYGFNAGEQGLVFLCIPVGVAIALCFYFSFLHFYFNPGLRKNGMGQPERRLIPGLYSSIVAPVGLFIFAWTGYNAPTIHWIVPTIGIALNTVCVFILFQCIFIYIPMTYPMYAASLFAANDFARSSVAAGAIHFSYPLFHNLGIDRGVTLLGGLMFGGVFGIYFLYYRGAWLRSRSKFALSW